MRPLLFVIAFFSSAIAMGQLVSSELIESYTAEEVQQIASSFSLPSDVIPLTYGVDFYRVEYTTLHPMGMEVLASGAVAVPQGVTCPRAIASYQHGTVAAKDNVPSQLNDEGLLGVLYASTGFVCTMPDYIGLGSSDVFHLYVHAESQATAVLDLIRLASDDLQEDLGYTWDGQLFLYGYSQGGHATMALHQYIETFTSDEFTVTASAPMSGPYDISGTQTDMLIDEVPFSAPGYLPYVVLSYQNAYGNLYDSLDEVFIEPYASNMLDWFDGENSMGYISSQMPSIPIQMLVPEYYDEFLNDPNHPLRLALEDNDVYDWTPEAPTRMFYCTEDEQVDFNNALVALETMLENGATQVDAVNGGPYTHGFCAPLALLGGYFFFADYYEAPFTVDLDLEVVDASGVGAADGSVSIVTDENLDDYTVVWSNGQQGTFIDGLDPGSYTVVISDSQGCTYGSTAFVGVITSVEEQDQAKPIIINPSQDKVRLIWETESELDR